MTTENPSSSTPPATPKSGGTVPLWGFILAVVVSAIVTIALAALPINIFQRKQEEKNPWVRLVEVDDNTTDPRQWGKNWAREYDGYQRTVDQTRTRYGGSDGSPTKSRLGKDPWLTRMFAGYAFAIDFRER